jgi:acetyltransferase-like isoleucine patch superfamily enzyme
MIRRILVALLPIRLRRSIRCRIDSIRRRLKAPSMVWGYRNANGIWRDKTRISDSVFFYHRENIDVGENVFVWHYTILDGTGGLEIGEGAQIGAWVGVFTHSSHIAIRLYGKHYQEVLEDDKKGYIVAPVCISRYAFIGAGAAILPGVTIGQGALVSAGSVVKDDVGDFQIVSGNPAVPIGTTKDIDSKYLTDEVLRSWYEEWQES